ncbi:alpha/beta fold hydrolase [Nocardia sp. NPDC058176]|uniref:alpha/beta fold hydrolase n=1 Tax=Nocardia sp. NPDC058176 TaxID=3346368 RepID=UPI0036D81707
MPEFHGVTGRIHYTERIPEQPRAVVAFFHGLGEHVGSYAPFFDALEAAGIAVWAHDHAGHGRSEGVRVLITSVDDLVADAATLTGLATTTVPDVPVFLIGHSLGALVASLLVAERGTTAAGLVLAGSSLVAEGSSWLGELLADGADPWELRRDPAEMTRDEAFAQQIREDPLTWQGGLRPETLTALIAIAPRLPGILAGLALPVLFVHGEDDDMAPAAGVRRAAELLPDARAVVFPADRHNILNELDRDEVFGAVTTFITARTEKDIA